MEDLTIRQLLDYFESRLGQQGGTFPTGRDPFSSHPRQQSLSTVGAFTGEGPCFPMSVIYLGREAAGAHPELSHRLLRIWPPYREELAFLQVCPGEGGEPAFALPDSQGEFLPCSRQEAARRVSLLFDVGSHFQNSNQLINFFLLDTTGCASLEDFRRLVALCAPVQRSFLAGSQIALLFLLLDDTTPLALQIRNELAEMFYGGQTGSHGLSSVIILSNRRGDNRFLREWSLVYRITAGLIALGDSQQPHLSELLFTPGVKTVGYAKSEKPSRKIAQVVLTRVLEFLDGCRTQSGGTPLLARPDLLARLGFTEEGTLWLLDQYADSQLLPLVPTAEQLELFPRYSTEFTAPVASYSFDEVDALTLGSWSCFLSQSALGANLLARDRQGVLAHWRQEYRAMLAQQFSADELAELAAQRGALGKLCFHPVPPNTGLPVLDCAQAMLRYNLSSDPEMAEVFLQAIADEGQGAQEFLAAWNRLVRSLGALFSVNDENLTTFYQFSVQAFLNQHDQELRSRFSRLNSVDQLWEFLTDLIDQIIAADPIYQAPFDVELQKRLEAAANPINARDIIRGELTGEQAVYFNAPFALHAPFLSAVLLKTDTPLCGSLSKTLKAGTRYYNTGCGDAAEAVELYTVDATNLVN